MENGELPDVPHVPLFFALTDFDVVLDGVTQHTRSMLDLQFLGNPKLTVRVLHTCLPFHISNVTFLLSQYQNIVTIMFATFIVTIKYYCYNNIVLLQQTSKRYVPTTQSAHFDAMWVDGCGGNPGPVDFEGNLLKGSRGVESYFGGLQKIMSGDDAHCEVVLARGQHNLQGTRSYLCLYPTDMALDNWLEPARHWNTFEAMGMLKRHSVHQ